MLRKYTRRLGTLMALVVVLGACRAEPAVPKTPAVQVTASPMATDAPQSTSTLVVTASATFESTAVPEVSPTPHTGPAGRLPSLLAQLDLGVEGGNAYGPAALAVDEHGRAYVACQTCDDCAERQAAIAAVDLRQGRVLEVWPLPGALPGALAVGGGWVYATYQDENYASRLVVLDATTGRTRSDIGTDWVSPESGIWLDAPRGRLYLAYVDRVEVRDAATLAVVDALPYQVLGTAAPVQIVVDARADRLYAAGGAALHAYQASSLTLLWQLPIAGERIDDLLVDSASHAVVLESIVSQETAPISEYYVVRADGTLSSKARPTISLGDWDLAWVDARAGRIVVQDRLRLPAGESGLRLTGLDLEGRPLGQPLVWWGAGALARLPPDASLYMLLSDAHALLAVDGATLTEQGRITLGVQLQAMAPDLSAGRVYVNDTAGRLYELDAGDLTSGALLLRRSTQAGSGQLLLDATGGRLLVAQAGGDAGRVSVVALAGLQVTRVITGGNRLALDTTRGRVLAGSAWSGYPPGDGQVQVWDLATGARVGSLPLGGVPAYNAPRDEICVAGYSAQRYSAETLSALGSLTPDVDAQECKGCTGQPAVRSVSAFPEHNVLALEMTVTAAGHGSGTYPAPRLFALDSLEPMSHALTLLPNTAGGWLAWPPAENRVYENLTFARYVSRDNLAVWDVKAQQLIDWWDGLSLEYLTPDGRTGFVARDGRWLAIDMASMTPVGYLPRHNVQAHDVARDLVLAFDGSRVAVLSAAGGQADPIPGPLPAALEAYPRAVVASPDYAHDRTLFVVGQRGLYRSQSGEGWEWLRGGLPMLDYGGLPGGTLVISPDYARDRTLYWSGCDSGSAGMGVWRSGDGGETWQPIWSGLRHLCVERLVLSPAYRFDGSLAAYCQYADLWGGEWGQSVWLSRDRGATWSLVASTAEAYSQPLPQPAELFGVPMTTSPVSPGPGWAGVGTGTGETYQQTLSFSEGESFVAQALSPAYPGDRTLFVLSTRRLYRSADDGQTWQVARGAAIDVASSDERFAALAALRDLSGALEVALLDESARLYLVTPADAAWEPVG